MFEKIKAILEARRAYKRAQNEEWYTKNAIEPVQAYRPAKSYEKGLEAGINAAKASGVLAAVFAGTRAMCPDYIPWSSDQDAVIVGAIITVASAGWSAYNAFVRNREKHFNQ